MKNVAKIKHYSKVYTVTDPFVLSQKSNCHLKAITHMISFQSM